MMQDWIVYLRKKSTLTKVQSQKYTDKSTITHSVLIMTVPVIRVLHKYCS
jgi:hypothetical protein